ncbi:(E)-beta-caryophyllene synthase-like [Hordeum vulgare subsp. vulgare]|uniref:Terpene synthase n=1 Tax=Hordeum vulgare subsp. vulgare TaxID=112509 RepID=A0A8I6WG28_HORVV|nr:(E)-beta-caryophyllene synthase-like [Hordeum vulgare subsp. vulgare]
MAAPANGSNVVTADLHEPRRHYIPSIWGHFFLNHNPCTQSQYLAMTEMASIKKERVRKSILAAGSSSDLPMKMELIDTLQRTGVAYHFGKEIQDLLRGIHADDQGSSDDLRTTAARFYLLRTHGYHVSPDVFLKFRDDRGNFVSNDADSLLALYNASYLRTRGEEVLDDAIIFTNSRLQCMLEHLEPQLAEEVRCALKTPIFRRVKRVETRRYIPVYEKKATRDEDILELAKLDFNILQTIYCKELKTLTIWWKDLKSQTDLQFARDRIVEMHFWVLGVVYEPQHSYSRVILTKLNIFISLFDDFYDNYSTTEESNTFTAAMERWDEQAAEQLPAHLKALYINILNTTNDFEEELKRQKNKNAELVKELVIDVAKCYHAEVKWRDEHYVPTSVEEHLQISVGSSACMHIISLVLISMGNVTTKEVLEWALTYPKIVRCVCIIGRIGNDMVSHEREQKSEHVVSTVQTCTKEHRITVAEANAKLRVIIEEAWMDIVHERLHNNHQMVHKEKATDLARTMDFMFKREDAYTLASSLKETLTSLYVNYV